MSRQTMPRIFELMDSIENPDDANVYFNHFEESIGEPLKRKHWLDIEGQLSKLDNQSWNLLKEKSIPRFRKKQKLRTWEQAFDTLNEAKAYLYLARTDCTNVNFVPENQVKGQRSPDISGLLGNRKTLCEVKTINPSKEEMERRLNRGVRTGTRDLTPGLFAKLSRQIESAKGQLWSHTSEQGTRKIVYFIVNFDDESHEYLCDYIMQLRAFLLHENNLGLEIVVDVKPPFHGSRTDSTPSEIYVKSEYGTWERQQAA